MSLQPSDTDASRESKPVIGFSESLPEGFIWRIGLTQLTTESEVSLFAKPRTCIIEEIITYIFTYTFRAQVNEFHTRDLPKDQSPLRFFRTNKTRVRSIFIMKLVTLNVIVYYWHGSFLR